jgi:peptide-methionine (S)-S-oxide reductase
MTDDGFEQATLGGGCFWCLEAVFAQLQGVESVVSGYCGGHSANPSYRSVCDGNTGHAEAVRITFDSAKLSYEELLEVFFAIHDPTTLNRQGNDVGTQYRSVIFHHSEAQRETALSLIRKFESEEFWNEPLVTEVRPEMVFHAAEDYHQQYFSKNPDQGYCQVVVAPKISKFRQLFWSRIKKKAQTDEA